MNIAQLVASVSIAGHARISQGMSLPTVLIMHRDDYIVCGAPSEVMFRYGESVRIEPVPNDSYRGHVIIE